MLIGAKQAQTGPEGGIRWKEGERVREREGLCWYMWVNNLPLAPFIGEMRVRGKEGGSGRERVRERSPPSLA